MVLFALRKLILQTRMRNHPMGLDFWCLVGPFFCFHTSCVRTAKALARYVISTKISWAGSFFLSHAIWHYLFQLTSVTLFLHITIMTARRLVLSERIIFCIIFKVRVPSFQIFTILKGRVGQSRIVSNWYARWILNNMPQRRLTTITFVLFERCFSGLKSENL